MKFDISCQEASSYPKTSIKTMYEFVASIYDCFWWVGLVLEIDTVQSDYTVSTLQPANSFFPAKT